MFFLQFVFVYVTNMSMTKKGKKVLVAMSGGVDSSVSAALLLEQGYHVEGAFIKTWSVPWLPCPLKEERRDAMNVAKQLDIPFRTVDLYDEYKENVADYFIEEYRKGNTPNPDVMCNKHVKFGAFFDFAMENNFDYVATGHYARIRKNKNDNTYQLLKGVDENKDQTYFLWTLKKEQLPKIIFPIGEYEKTEVRKLAEKFNLGTAKKKDSQGICFLGKVNMKEFLSHYIEIKKGDVLNEKGEVVGEHDGAVFLTLGQRHGFTIFQKTPDTKPLYVIKKNIEKNTITVSEKKLNENKNNIVSVKDVNWISDPKQKCEARIRYRQKLFHVVLNDVKKESCNFSAKLPDPYVSKGQSVVFYDRDVCFGGGVID